MEISDDIAAAEQQQHTGPRITILWDLLKNRLRPSELSEMSRLIGPEKIDTLEDLRSELENLISINNDIRQTRLIKDQQKQDSRSMMSTTMTKSIFSETKNASFLNQELVMFIDNLQQKATRVGLKEDALIPQDTKKDKQIYEQVRQSMTRPQSAHPGATGEHSADQNLDESASKKKMRNGSPTQTAMRSSFYSISLLNEDERQEALETEEFPKRYQDEQKKRGAIVDQLNIKNILELSQREKEVLQQIKNFMTLQESELQQEISVMQKLMLEQATQKQNDSDDEGSNQEEELLTQQDLKEYSKKLQDGLLNSDQTIKIASLPSPAISLGSSKRPGLMNPLDASSFATAGAKLKPIGAISTAAIKPAATGRVKTPIKLRPGSRASLKAGQSGPVKAFMRPPDGIPSAQTDPNHNFHPHQSSEPLNPKTTQIFKADGKTLEASSSNQGDFQQASSQQLKKFKMSSVVKVGKPRPQGSTGQWKNSAQRQVEDGSCSATKIPINKIKIGGTGNMQAASTTPVSLQHRRNSSRTAHQKLKVTSSQNQQRQSTTRTIIEDPQIILTQNSVKAKKKLAATGKNDPSMSKESTNLQQQSFYGLDLDILKDLQLDGLVEEKKSGDAEYETQSDAQDMMNKTMTQLREEHGLEPGLNTAANRLRRRCNYYQQKYSDHNVDVANESDDE